MLIFLFSTLLSFANHGVEGTPCEEFFPLPPVAPRIQIQSQSTVISKIVKHRMNFYSGFKSCYDWAITQKKDLIANISKKQLWRDFIKESELENVIFSVGEEENSDQIGLLEQKETILRSPSGVPAIMVFAALNGISWYMAAKIDRDCELEIERLGGHKLAMQNGYYPECGVQEVYLFEDVALASFSVFQKMNFLSGFKFKSIVDFENTKVIAEVIAEGSETIVKDSTRFKNLVNSISNTARESGLFSGSKFYELKSNSSYITVKSFFREMAGKVPLPVKKSLVKSFDLKTIKENVLDKDLIVYRWHNNDDAAKRLGRFVSDTPLNEKDAARRLLALPSSNKMLVMEKYKIPKGTKIFRGKVAPLNGQPGGGSQIYITGQDINKLLIPILD